jgi:hypothetical protein
VTAALLLLLPCVTPEPVEAPRYGVSRPAESHPGHYEKYTPKGWLPSWQTRTQRGVRLRFYLVPATGDYYPSILSWPVNVTETL